MIVQRVVVWVSAGASSAVAAKLELARGPAVLVYTDPGSEHEDNARFLDDCEEWFGQEVLRLKSEKYRDTWDVWEQTRYLVGPQGARCTAGTGSESIFLTPLIGWRSLNERSAMRLTRN